jgi:hypothetical protein
MRRTVCVLLGLVVLGGCAGGSRLPRLFGPGTASAQRMRAQQFDPYPQRDIAPLVDGGRPREYLQPPPEATRIPVGAKQRRPAAW